MCICMYVPVCMCVGMHLRVCVEGEREGVCEFQLNLIQI